MHSVSICLPLQKTYFQYYLDFYIVGEEQAQHTQSTAAPMFEAGGSRLSHRASPLKPHLPLLTHVQT